MRPLRLEAEGFTCYRDRQAPLDFGGLSLFAIAGPTGAGKSSILDAMLYALYGEVPRIGKKGIGEFISHGRDALSVVFDFALRGSAYRIARRARRNRNGNLSTAVTLAELTPDGERHIADDVRPVQREVVKLIGLDYEAFTQTVVLPQGEFARFLRAEPKAQREILQRLLRHEIFQRMRDEADNRRRNLENVLGRCDGALGQVAHATEEARAATASALAAARESLAQATTQRLARQQELQETKERRRLTEELARLHAQRENLDQEEPAMAQLGDELALARRAAAIVPRIEAEAGARARVEARSRDRDEALAASNQLSHRHARAEQAAAKAVRAAGECVSLNERIRRIDEIKGDLERRRRLAAEIETLGTSMRTARARATQVKKKLDAARTVLDASARALQEARTAVDGTPYDEGEDARIGEVWADVVLVRTVDDEIAGVERQRQQLQDAVAEAERREEGARRSEEAAAAAAQKADEALQAAAAAYVGAHERHRAAALRAHLHAGGECPVCLQTVTRVPDVPAPPELRSLENARKAAETRQAAAARRATEAREAFTEARAALGLAAASLRDCSSRIAERTTTRDALVARVAASMAGIGPGLDAASVLPWVERRREELQRLKAAYARAAGAVREAEAAFNGAQLLVVQAEATATAADTDLARHVEDDRRCRDELARVNAAIAAVSAHEDPSVERAELARRVQELERNSEQARTELGRVVEELAAASARLEAARAALADAGAEAAERRADVSAALADAGFSDAAAARSAARSSSQLQELDARIRAHQDARAAVTDRLRDVEPRIAGREVDAAALEAVERRAADAEAAVGDAQAAVSRLEHESAALDDAVARRTALVAERDTLRDRLAVTAELATDLRGDAFQEYLLEEAFRGLVAGASLRMRQISNRYTLEWEGGDFFVVDHDNAGERRRAETLSGGETFMASLCLALQLSDEVLRTSGALQMDSLFIDEGFGTLDAQSLSEVTDAMEALRQDGGRLIGVISHRPELTDRLPGCIRIEKGTGESRWRLERVG